MSQITGKKRLELFNERAESLSGFSFFQKFIDSPNAVQIKFNSGRFEVTTNFPDQEATSAFVHVFRQFIQNNDPISFGNMAKEYESLNISQELKDEFKQVRDSFNTYLDSPPKEFSMAESGPTDADPGRDMTPTRREIMEVFVYGFLSHSNAEKRAKFEHWRGEPVSFAMLANYFNHILMNSLRHIIAIKVLNNDALKLLP